MLKRRRRLAAEPRKPSTLRPWCPNLSGLKPAAVRLRLAQSRVHKLQRLVAADSEAMGGIERRRADLYEEEKEVAER